MISLLGMFRLLLASLLTFTGAVALDATMPPVYHPSRLQVVQPMETGTVLTDPVRQADGDATFEFRVQSTTTERHVEITCMYTPRFDAAREACAGYHNRVLIPHQGDHVRIAGPLVRDLVHDAEFPNLEIHPAVTIVELGA
jgi:hypothetical protein